MLTLMAADFSLLSDSFIEEKFVGDNLKNFCCVLKWNLDVF